MEHGGFSRSDWNFPEPRIARPALRVVLAPRLRIRSKAWRIARGGARPHPAVLHDAPRKELRRVGRSVQGTLPVLFAGVRAALPAERMGSETRAKAWRVD